MRDRQTLLGRTAAIFGSTGGLGLLTGSQLAEDG